MRILCFGDSNTYGFDPRSYLGGRYPAEHRWPDIIAAATGWEILNDGVNGRRIPRAEYEFPTLLSRPDLLVIMQGSNDILQGASAAEAAVRMESFISRLPFPRSHIMLIAPPAMTAGTWVSDEKLAAESCRLAREYEAIAVKMGICFADAGGWQINLCYDGVHFSENGHHTFANSLLPLLKTLYKI